MEISGPLCLQLGSGRRQLHTTWVKQDSKNLELLIGLLWYEKEGEECFNL